MTHIPLYLTLSLADIKPQNLLLVRGDDAHIKIADFGFARRVHTQCSLTSLLGTP